MAYAEILRQAAHALREGSKISLSEQVLGLVTEIEGLKAKVAELDKKAVDLAMDNGLLEKKLQETLEQYGFQPGELEFHEGLLWITHDPLRRDKTRTAICQKCWQADKRVMRHVVILEGKESGFNCVACGAENRMVKEKANR